MGLSFREEFRLRNLGLGYDHRDAFYTSQWRWPQPVFVVYRLVAASYVIGWNIYGYVTIPTFGHHVTIVFYTNWSYLILGLHLSLALFVTLFHSAKNRRNPKTRPVPAVAAVNGTAARGTTTSATYHELHECREALLTPDTGVPHRRGNKRHRRVIHYNNNNDYHKAGKPQQQRLQERVPMAAEEQCQRSRTHSQSPRVCRNQNCSDVVTQGTKESRAVGTKHQGVFTEFSSTNHRQDKERSKRSRHQRHRHGEMRQGENRRHLLEVAPSAFTVPTHGNRANPKQTKPHERNSIPPVGAEAAHIYEELEEALGKSKPTGHRRKKQHRVYHRTGRSVGFKYKSSTSSLDKIRHRRSRPTLEPRSFEKGQKGESSQGSHLIAGRDPHVQHVKRYATCLARAHTSERTKEPRASYLVDTCVDRRRNFPSKSCPKGGEMLQRIPQKPNACVASTEPVMASVNLQGNRKHRNRAQGKHSGSTSKSRGAKSGHHHRGHAPKISRCHTTDNPVEGHPSAEPGQCPRLTTKSANQQKENIRSVGTRTCPEDLRFQNVTTANAITPNNNNNNSNNNNAPSDVIQGSRGNSERLPCYVKVLWAVFNMAAVSGPVVTAVYFFILFPMLQREQPSFRAGILDINLHGVNSLIVLLEMTISAIPVRLLHFIYPLLYGVVYVLFSLAYWGYDTENNVLYPVILDWNHPGITCAVVVVLVFVATPLFQLLWYGVYRLRLLVFAKVCGEDSLPNPHTERPAVKRKDETHV